MEKNYSFPALKSTPTIQTQTKEIQESKFNKCYISASLVQEFTCKKTNIVTSMFNTVQRTFNMTLPLDYKGDKVDFGTFGVDGIGEGGVSTPKIAKVDGKTQCLDTSYPPLLFSARSTLRNNDINITKDSSYLVLNSCSTCVEQGANP